ncbi:hypothetical protein ACSAZK_02720 [Methanosarcina sp. Mfa9]|uniref:hypothetical protein n=1 Tax=Methanosarcina sp. Mfa9 TaxID=3439063 RepID=UPI003F8665BA
MGSSFRLGVCPVVQEVKVLVHLPAEIPVFDAGLWIHSPGDGDGQQVTAAVEVQWRPVLPGL